MKLTEAGTTSLEKSVGLDELGRSRKGRRGGGDGAKIEIQSPKEGVGHDLGKKRAESKK